MTREEIHQEFARTIERYRETKGIDHSDWNQKFRDEMVVYDANWARVDAEGFTQELRKESRVIWQRITVILDFWGGLSREMLILPQP